MSKKLAWNLHYRNMSDFYLTCQFLYDIMKAGAFYICSIWYIQDRLSMVLAYYHIRKI